MVLHLYYILLYRSVNSDFEQFYTTTLRFQGRWAGVKKIDMIAANTPVFLCLQPLLPPYPSPCLSLLCYDPLLIQISSGRKTENHYCRSAACFKKSTQSFDRFVLSKVDPDGSMKYELEEEQHFRSR